MLVLKRSFVTIDTKEINCMSLVWMKQKKKLKNWE